MAGELVLLTGGSGHVGYRTLIEALAKGYKVRAAVRSESKIAQIKAAKPTQPYLEQLTFTIVPNIEKDGAFDQAVQGVDYIVHAASPVARPSDDDEANIIQPAIRGTLSILYSALKQRSVKRVVITSSIVAVNPDSPTGPFTADNVEPDPHGPYHHVFAAYSASKKLAYNRTRDFIAREKPQFTVVHIMPSFVIGPNELATTPDTVLSGSNAIALGVLFGAKNPSGLPGATVHTDDVAFLHIAALEPKVQGNRNFGANFDVNGIKWDEAIDIVKKHFPTEVEKGVFPLGGSQTSLPIPFDASESEKFFGFKFKDFETQIVDIAGYYAKVAAGKV
ncbi:reductase [Cladophialophora carrionii]|uniref:Reductase n=1 Tax=Cladophialophora carrionii TaxID=86049 RepID=A0A1C1D0F1_9EURO|nr:reductase [Cladophialophora carrionii]